MPNPITLRPATPADLPAINAIYNHYVAHSTCLWITQPWSAAQRQAWFDEHTSSMPIFIAQSPTQIVGWASLSTFRNAYTLAGTLEDSIYIHHEFHHQGIGTLLLTHLIASAKTLRLRSLLANISADQTPSIRLHEKLGFQKVAHIQQVGFKFNQYLDAVYLQLMLTNTGPQPT